MQSKSKIDTGLTYNEQSALCSKYQINVIRKVSWVFLARSSVDFVDVWPSG